MQKRFAAAGLAAGLAIGTVAGAAVGVPSLVSAQTTTTTEATPDATAPDAGRPAPGEWFSEALAPLVTDGTLTQAQADAAVAALEAARPEGPGGGFGGPHGGRVGGHRFDLDVAAEALGITADELRTALEGGQSIAEVAQANGVDVATVVDAIVADVRADLAERVADGDLTQEEADTKLADVEERVTALVNGELPSRGPGWGGPPDAGGTEDSGA